MWQPGWYYIDSERKQLIWKCLYHRFVSTYKFTPWVGIQFIYLDYQLNLRMSSSSFLNMVHGWQSPSYVFFFFSKATLERVFSAPPKPEEELQPVPPGSFNSVSSFFCPSHQQVNLEFSGQALLLCDGPIYIYVLAQRLIFLLYQILYFFKI